MEQPNFYAILPANVRYCKSLNPFEKILYAEITALTQKDWYCWASNKYFAELYWVSETHISLRIKKICNLWFLSSEVDKEAWNKRRIFVWELRKVTWKTSLTTVKDPIELELNSYLTKVKDPYLTKVKENNINKNNKKNKEKIYKKENFLKLWELENVKLTEEEKNKLLEKYWEAKTNEYIEKLSLYIWAKWDKYKSHYAVILTWMRNEEKGKVEEKRENNDYDKEKEERLKRLAEYKKKQWI